MSSSSHYDRLQLCLPASSHPHHLPVPDTVTMPHFIRLPQASQIASLVLVHSSPANPSVFPGFHLPLPQSHRHRSWITPRMDTALRLPPAETSAALLGLLPPEPIPHLRFPAPFMLPVRSPSTAKTRYPVQHKPAHRIHLLLRTSEPSLLFLHFGSLPLVRRQNDQVNAIEEISRNRYRLLPNPKPHCLPTTGMKAPRVSLSTLPRNACYPQRLSRTCWPPRTRRNRANNIIRSLALPPLYPPAAFLRSHIRHHQRTGCVITTTTLRLLSTPPTNITRKLSMPLHPLTRPSTKVESHHRRQITLLLIQMAHTPTLTKPIPEQFRAWRGKCP